MLLVCFVLSLLFFLSNFCLWPKRPEDTVFVFADLQQGQRFFMLRWKLQRSWNSFRRFPVDLRISEGIRLTFRYEPLFLCQDLSQQYCRFGSLPDSLIKLNRLFDGES